MEKKQLNLFPFLTKRTPQKSIVSRTIKQVSIEKNLLSTLTVYSQLVFDVKKGANLFNNFRQLKWSRFQHRPPGTLFGFSLSNKRDKRRMATSLVMTLLQNWGTVTEQKLRLLYSSAFENIIRAIMFSNITANNFIEHSTADCCKKSWLQEKNAF